VTSGEVVGSIFLSRDELLWVEELSVGTRSNLVNDGWFKIDHNTSWDVFSSSSLGEEGAESIISRTRGLIRWELTIRGDSVLKTEELPTGITNLDTSLTDVD
jgi:hypothetical protein